MKIWGFVCILFALLTFSACEKNTVSKIPTIGFIEMGPALVRVNTDTCYVKFSMADGDADLGQQSGGGTGFDIYIKDFKNESAGFHGYYFPADIDASIEDPKKGITGTCIFEFLPFMSELTPRTDTMHKKFDTTHFAIFIMDRAGNRSDTIMTPDVIIKLP